MRAIAVLAIAGVALVASSIAGGRSLRPGPSGLRAALTADGRTIQASGSVPDTADLEELVARGGSGRAFSVVWSGHVWSDGGDYLILLGSDDAGEVLIDGRTVVATPGEHPFRTRAGRVSLDAGSHAVEVKYEQFRSNYGIQVDWARAGGLPRRWMHDRWRLSERPLTEAEASARRWAARVPHLLVAAGLSGVLVLYVAAGLGLCARARRSLGVPPVARGEIALLVVAGAWLTYGVAWGLPSPSFTWAPDEISPFLVNQGYAAGFRNGWANTYPPVVFYLDAPGPWIVGRAASAWAWNTFEGDGQAYLHLFIRLVVVLTALGALAGLHSLQRQRMSPLASVAGCAAAWLSPSLAYYSRVSNPDVPSLMFVVWACAFLYAHFYRRREAHLYAAAVLATLAFSSKDQAGAFFVFWPVVLVALHIATSPTVAWAVFDRRWLWAGVSVALTLSIVFLLPVNLDGVREHIRWIRQGVYPTEFPATLKGYLGFLGLLGELLLFIAGPALVGLAVAGWLWAVARREWGLVGVLALPLGSYLIGFLLFVRYAYDRYLIVVWALTAVGVGYLIEAARERQWTFKPIAAAVALALAWAGAKATVVGVLEQHDNRYALERFMAQSVPPDRSVALFGLKQYFPRIVHPRTTSSEILAFDPDVDVILINEDIVARFAQRNREALDALRSGAAGFQLVLACGEPSWPTLGVAPILKAFTGLTNLDKINPTFTLWSRAPIENAVSPSRDCRVVP
jgi:hypothetical protein